MTTRYVLPTIALAVLFSGPGLDSLAAQPSDDNEPAERRDRGGRRGGQRGGPRGGMGGFGMMGGAPAGAMGRAALLRSEQVKEELKIDQDMALTLQAALEAYSDDARGARPDFRRIGEMTDEERAKEMERVQKASAELTKKTDETLAALLEPKQLERLDQIALQLSVRMNPIGAMKDVELRKKLGLTDEQAAKLDDAEKAANEKQGAMREEMMAGFQSGERPDFDKFREKGEAVRQEIAELVMAVLTDDQSAELAALQGKEFDLDMSQLARGGGRGGFGRGGFGGGGRRGGRDGGGRRGGREGGGRRNQRPPVEDAE